MSQPGVTIQARPALRLQFWSELASVALMLMELFWLSSWYEVLATPESVFTTTILYLGIVLYGSHVLIRWLNGTGLRSSFRRIAFGGWVVAAAYAGLGLLLYPNDHLTWNELLIHPLLTLTLSTYTLKDFWHLLFTLIIVWRGVRWAGEHPGLTGAQAGFQVGLLLLLFYGLGFSWLKPAQSITTLYGFLFASLLAMCSARISELTLRRGGRLPSPSRSWTLGIFGSVILVVGLGIAAGWLFSTWAISAASQLFTILITVVTLITLLVLSPLILLILWFFPSIMDAISQMLNSPALQALRNLLAQIGQQIQQIPAWVILIIKTAAPIILGLVLIAVIVVIYFSNRWRQFRPRLVGEEHELEAGSSSILNLPAFSLARLRRRLFGRGSLLAATRIRWIYVQLMRLSSDLGSPRPPSITPREFLPRLGSIFPEDQDFLSAITEAYIKVRYGEYPETSAEVEEVVRGWDVLREHARKIKAEIKRNPSPH